MPKVGFSTWFVCLCVDAYSSTTGYEAAYNGNFPETTVIEKYFVITSEKANMCNRNGFPRPDPLSLCTLEVQEITTKAVYRLPHAIY